MKKILILTLCALSFSVLNAQDGTGSFKQNSGDKSLELQFDPGAIFNSSNGNNVLSNGLGIRFRLFPSESLAYRLNVNINFSNTSEVTQDADDTGNEELKYKETDFGVFIRPGIEKHFAGTKRLSPYIGAELNVGFLTSNYKQETQAVAGDPVYIMETKNANPNAGLTFGAAALAGADFYISPKLYLGVELSYGLNYFMASEIKITDSDPNGTDATSKVGKTNSFTFEPGAMGVFRIGFLFGGSGQNSSIDIDTDN